MRYGEAFEALGFRLVAFREDWSAERDDAVCLTVWMKPQAPGHPAARREAESMVYDTRDGTDDPAAWNASALRKRTLHAGRALGEFDGWIDVVCVWPSDRAGERVRTAVPWQPRGRRGHRWRVAHLDEETGHIRLQTEPSPFEKDVPSA